MTWQKKADELIRRTSRANRRVVAYGRAARRAWVSTDGVDRLVPSPVFVLSGIRSGSTLFRVILNSHSQICAPHELHLRAMQVRVERAYAQKAVAALGLSQAELEHLLWDRVLHRELQRSGKRIIVDKTPANAMGWKRLTKAWPDARFIFLLRHPASMVASMKDARPDRTDSEHYEHALGYLTRIEEAREALPGLTVRYEDLTSDPVAVTQEVCRFLGVRWESSMLDYGSQDHGPFRAGIGDWSKKIRSGQVQASRPLPKPEEVPVELREISALWGYIPADDPSLTQP